jgi:hypothetical protein
MDGTLKRCLGVIGFGFHVLSVLFAIGLVANLVWSLLKRDFSQWWLWPTGLFAVAILVSLAGYLLRLADKTDFRTRSSDDVA